MIIIVWPEKSYDSNRQAIKLVDIYFGVLKWTWDDKSDNKTEPFFLNEIKVKAEQKLVALWFW